MASQLAGGLELSNLNAEAGRYHAMNVYSTTKQANRLMAGYLNELNNNSGNPNPIFFASVMPGVVTSTLLTNLGMFKGRDSAEQAACGPSYLALTDDIGLSPIMSNVIKSIVVINSF